MKIAIAGVLSSVVLVSSAASAQDYGQPQQPGSGQPGSGSQPSYAETQRQGQNGNMQSGGLAPPGTAVGADPFAPSTPSTPTEQELERADREDAGRGLTFVWLNGEVGIEHLGLQTFKANGLVDAETVATTQTGPVFGGGLGLRLVFVTLGARFRLGTFDEWQLWTLNAELGIRIPLGNVEPYFTFGGGYASIGAFDTANVGGDLNNANVSITGFDVRGGFGVDIFLSSAFSIGANLTGEVLVLTRPGVDPSKLNASGSATQQQAAAEVYAADGSSIGLGTTLTGVAGLHF